MRTLALTFATAAAALAGASVTAQAGATSGADALRTALGDVQLVDKVHCRPGRWHHRSSGDGCSRRTTTRYYHQPYYGGYAYSPYSYGYSPYHYGYGYGPGIGFSFRVR